VVLYCLFFYSLPVELDDIEEIVRYLGDCKEKQELHASYPIKETKKADNDS
jgi:hypothetical protein